MRSQIIGSQCRLVPTQGLKEGEVGLMNTDFLFVKNLKVLAMDNAGKFYLCIIQIRKNKSSRGVRGVLWLGVKAGVLTV